MYRAIPCDPDDESDVSAREKKLSYDEGDEEEVRLERSAISRRSRLASVERGDRLRSSSRSGC
jgi:hypothetical protein